MLDSVGYVRPLKRVDSVERSEGNGSSPENASTTFQPEPYEDATPGKILEILRVRNRFDMEKNDRHWSGGFRDLAFKVKVGYKVPPVDHMLYRAAHSELSQPFNNVIAGVLDWSTAICARVWPAAYILPPQCLQAASCHLTLSALQEPLGRRLRQDPRLRAADSPPSE